MIFAFLLDFLCGLCELCGSFNLFVRPRGYWEGSVSVQGTQEGQPVSGKGYVELVGYTQQLTQNLPE